MQNIMGLSAGLWLAIIGAAIAAGFAGIGSAIGIGYAGRTAAGVLSEEPSLFSKLLILLGLPGTQGIYGFVIAFLILSKLGITAGNPAQISTALGLQYMAAGIPIGLAGWMSAIHQGKVCSAGIELVSKRPEDSGKAIVMGVFVEFYAVLGLLVSLFVVLNLPVKG